MRRGASLVAFIAGMSTLVWLVAVRPAGAQTETATLIGTVTDVQGGALPGATVTARNTDTGFVLTTVTDSEGRYRMAAVPPGRYEMTVQLAGFSTAVRRGLTLTLGSENVINFELQVAALAEEVTVTAETPVVQTTTTAVQVTMTREQIDLLPLIGREYTSLLRLVPGAQSSNGTAFTGSRGRSNQWVIDGVDNSEDISGYERQTPALDAIKEVQVLVNGFKAEYGQASGGVINVITRSGTNDLHGSGFFLFRNQDLMARSPYADRSLPKDPFRRIHYGGTLGGPIKRDRLLYFVTYEREDRDTFTASTRTLPARSAPFAASTLRFLEMNGIPLSLFPETERTIRQTRPEYVDVHKLTARLDEQFDSNRFLTFRYTFERDHEPSGSSGTLLDYNGASAFFRTNYGNVNYKWISGSTRLHETYFQFGQSFGNWYVFHPNLTNVTVTGAFSLGGPSNYPQGRTDYVYQVVHNFTWNRSGGWGEHAIKTGVQIKVFRSDSFFDSNFRGTYTFPNLAAFIAGRPSRFTQNQGDSRLKRPNQIYGLYIQDDWRPTPSLTFNVGLRYDYEGAKTEALRDVEGRPGPGISRDKNNFAPRFGFAWAPGGSTKQSFYGGTGIYYDQIILNIIGNARFTPPKVIGIQIDNPSWPDPFAGGTVRIPPPSLSVIDPDLVTPLNWNSQVGYRRELLSDLGLDVSFVYNRGYDHVFIINRNAGIPGTATLLGAGARRPNPNYTNINFYTNIGEIRYRGLLVELRKRFSRGFQSGLAYTLSQTRDNSFNFVSGVQVPERPDLNWGPGTDDRRHRLESHLEVDLPWGLQLGAIVEYRTEAPLNIFASGRDLNGDGITGDWVHEEICRTIACPGFRYSRNSVRELPTEEANRLRRLFGLGPVERFENNPKYFNMDVTLQKRVRVGGQTARFTLEAFNVFNVPQRNQPNQNIFSSNFGKYESVVQPRAVQMTFQVDW